MSRPRDCRVTGESSRETDLDGQLNNGGNPVAAVQSTGFPAPGMLARAARHLVPSHKKP
jgi:hypothetical protein